MGDKLEECTASLEADAKTKLTMAISCVTAAEKTLNDFRDFLKEDKYKEFNDEQNKRHEESLKSMIGEMPQGVPHKKPEAEKREVGRRLRSSGYSPKSHYGVLTGTPQPKNKEIILYFHHHLTTQGG